MINAVVIPVALDHPLRCVELDPHDFAAYQGPTGGNMQTHELHNPAMTLYSNGVSVTPLNIRATLVAWVHNRELAYQTMIAGQAILTGNVTGQVLRSPCCDRALDDHGAVDRRGGLIFLSWGLMISRCPGRRRLRSCVSGSRSATC